MVGKTWAEHRDEHASGLEQLALDCLRSRNPVRWYLAYRFARLARGVRAMEMTPSLEDIGAIRASLDTKDA